MRSGWAIQSSWTNGARWKLARPTCGIFLRPPVPTSQAGANSRTEGMPGANAFDHGENVPMKILELVG